MRAETWDNGKLVSVTDDGKPAPVARAEEMSKIAADADKAATVAALRDLVKRLLAIV